MPANKKMFITTTNTDKPIDDEFYTLYKDAERIIGQFNLKDKKVYCCCDSEESNIVKYLKDKVGELKYSSDNYENHADLFKWCDVIVTNPPFSKWAERYRYFRSYGKKFILCGSFLSSFNKELLEDYKYNNVWICGKSTHFLKPDGTKSEVKTLWYTNLDKPSPI